MDWKKPRQEWDPEIAERLISELTVQRVELTDECIEKIADAVARRIREVNDGIDNLPAIRMQTQRKEIQMHSEGN